MSDKDDDSIVKRIEGAEPFVEGNVVAFAAVRAAVGTRAVADESAPPAAESAAREDAGEGARKPPKGAGGDLDWRCAHIPMTDLGNAERFAARHAMTLRFCPEIGWLWWDGRRWASHGGDERVKRAEHTTVRAIQDEARALADSDHDFVTGTRGRGDDKIDVLLSMRLREWGRESESAARLAAISKRAAAMLAVDVTTLDADPMKINVLNGTLHVAKRDDADYIDLRPHEPADYITKLAPVAYEPEAVAPRFHAFLDRIQPAAEGAHANPMQRFLQQWFGYSLTGDTGEQKMCFFYGRGRNGKGVLVNLIAHVAGDYAASVGIETFLDSGRARAGGQATPDIAKLPGVRMLTTSEPKKGASLDEGLVKLITGGDPIDARHLNKNFFQFVPQLKLTMQGNYRPKVSGTDEGIWGRVKLVPFGVFIPAEERDPHLIDKLKDEASGVLNWLLDGLRLERESGIQWPDAVEKATADYRSDSDPLGRFIDACTMPDPDARIGSSEMHALFVAWARANGETEWSAKGLAAALKERGWASKKSDTVFWLDHRLTHFVSDFIDADGKPRRRGAQLGDDPGEGDDDA